MNAKASLGAARPAIDRIAQIARMIRANKFNTQTMAADLEVCTKTLQRDLEFLRDRLRHDIEYDASTRAWRYTRLPECVLL